MGQLSSTLLGSADAWDAESITDLTGKVALVTGANTGIGWEIAKELATHGARVLLAGRDKQKVDDAVKRLKACRPTCTVEGYVVDLAQFSSMDAFAKELKDKVKLKALHILVANAGVFMPPHAKTANGFEVQLGTNHFGTVYLTQLMLPFLKAGKPARVVVLSSSLASMVSEIAWEDLGGEALGDSLFSTYAMSKLYNALYAMELNKRCGEAAGVEAFAVHPGRFVATDIQNKANKEHWFSGKVLPHLTTLFAISPADGALSALYAATASAVAGKGGSMYGPGEMNTGFTSEWRPTSRLLTPENAAKLLDETLKLIAAKGGKLDAK